MKKIKYTANVPSLFEELGTSNQEKMIAALGHELQIGDSVEWWSSGHILIGVITAFENGKCVIQTRACRCANPEDFEEIKKKAKRCYKVNPGKCFKLVKINK